MTESGNRQRGGVFDTLFQSDGKVCRKHLPFVIFQIDHTTGSVAGRPSRGLSQPATGMRGSPHLWLYTKEESVPDFVMKNDEDGFYSRLGLAIIDEAVLDIKYTFTYTSDGGLVQRSTSFPLNENTVSQLIDGLESRLTTEAFTKEQRALMTSSLRKYIKERDHYTCCSCGNSIYKEPNLLLEVDHITPIALGGLTREDNLQTLCWKCNRSKGAKLIS